MGKALQMACTRIELRPTGSAPTDREALTPDTSSPGLILEIADGPEGSAEEVEKVL
jgi:hypothetical protein